VSTGPTTGPRFSTARPQTFRREKNTKQTCRRHRYPSKLVSVHLHATKTALPTRRPLGPSGLPPTTGQLERAQYPPRSYPFVGYILIGYISTFLSRMLIFGVCARIKVFVGCNQTLWHRLDSISAPSAPSSLPPRLRVSSPDSTARLDSISAPSAPSLLEMLKMSPPTTVPVFPVRLHRYRYPPESPDYYTNIS
jgi:hypothetical protein